MTRPVRILLPALLFFGAAATGCRSGSSAVPTQTTASFVGVADNPAESTEVASGGETKMLDGEHAAYVVVGDTDAVPGVDRSPLEEQLTVVILHGRAGLTDYERRFANGLAQLGFTAIVPDLGPVAGPLGAPTTPEQYQAITAATHYATQMLPVRARQVVLIGFADGAAHALRVAAMEDHVSAVVAYTPPDNVDTPDDVRALVFTDAYGFERPAAPAYDRAASDRAWKQVKSFLTALYDPYLASS